MFFNCRFRPRPRDSIRVPFGSGLFECVMFGSVRFDLGLFVSVPNRVCIILFYFDSTHHFSEINAGLFGSFRFKYM